jgi:hypothetical protein
MIGLLIGLASVGVGVWCLATDSLTQGICCCVGGGVCVAVAALDLFSRRRRPAAADGLGLLANLRAVAIARARSVSGDRPVTCVSLTFEICSGPWRGQLMSVLLPPVNATLLAEGLRAANRELALRN